MRSRAAVLGVLAAASLLLVGCSGSKGSGDVTGHDRLIDELASQVDSSFERGYTASYLLADGEATGVVVNQAEPARTAFVFPEGTYLVTDEYVMTCDTAAPPTCVQDAVTEAAMVPDTAAIGKIGGGSYLAAQTVIDWLTEASASSGVAIESETRSIAGEHATCLSVSGATDATVSDFEACFTDTGMLGSFTGTVDGQENSITLKSYSDDVDVTVFEVPDKAEITDNRD